MTINVRDLLAKVSQAKAEASANSGEANLALSDDELDLLSRVLTSYLGIDTSTSLEEFRLKELKTRRIAWTANWEDPTPTHMMNELDAEIAELQRKLGEMLPPNPNDLQNVNA